MSEISFLQKYSEKEDHLTNNTLLVLRHFHLQHPQILKGILLELLDAEEDINSNIKIGPVFEQQITIEGSQSRPDALIFQKPLEIYFEVKRGGLEDEWQIQKYIEDIKNRDEANPSATKKILFALTAKPIAGNIIGKLSDLAKANSIDFKAITFDDVLSILKGCCADYEVDLNYILDDYEQYLIDGNLLSAEYLTIMPVGKNMKYHKEFRLYHRYLYSRGHKITSKFLGLYEHWCVRYIGRVEAVVRGGLGAEDKFEIEKDGVEFCRDGYELEDGLQRITKAISTGEFPGIKQDHIFYLLSELEETNFCKRERYKGNAVRSLQHFKLSDWLEEDKKEYELDEVAEGLRKVKF